MKHKGAYITISLLVLGAGGYFLYRYIKKKKGGEEPTKPQKKVGKLTIPPIEKSLADSSSDFLKKKFNLSDKNSSKDPSKILKVGLKNDEDVKRLQNYLNIQNQKAIKQNKSPFMPINAVVENGYELKIDGDFGADTESSLGWHTTKTTISVGDLNKLIGKDIGSMLFGIKFR